MSSEPTTTTATTTTSIPVPVPVSTPVRTTTTRKASHTSTSAFTSVRSKTKKSNRSPLTPEEVASIWNQFHAETEMNPSTDTAMVDTDATATPRTEPEPMVCIYSRCVHSPSTASSKQRLSALEEGDEPSLRSVCEMCRTLLITNEDGYLECPNSRCGILYTDVLDHSPEWRFYGADDANGTDPARCGMPIDPLFENSAYGCKMYANSGTSHEMRKVGQFTKWMSMPYRETKLYNDIQHITTYSRLSGISQKIIDDACAIYIKLFNADQKYRGTNHEGLMASSLYYACIQNQCARTVKEVSNVFHIDVSVTTNGCKLAQGILMEWNASVKEEREKVKLTHATPEQFVERYCSHLQWDKEKTMLARFIARRVVQLKEMQENKPNAMCAGILYFIAKTFQMETTKHEISQISEMSDVTVSKCCSKLEAMATQLLPKQYQTLATATGAGVTSVVVSPVRDKELQVQSPSPATALSVA